MCPAAEEILGRLASQDSRIVPIAFHVDYFNKPWKDVFSDPLYSRRQWVYNEVYAKPKPEGFGLNYTPMLMIDGEQSVNGREPAAALAAIRAARSRKPLAKLDARLDPAENGRSATVTVDVSARSWRVVKRPLLLCAVLREDGVVTNIPSGENAGKALTARFPARSTKFEFIELTQSAPVSRSFDFEIDPAWNRKALRLALFVQDKQTAAVYQAADLPWRAAPSKDATNLDAAPHSGTEKASKR